MNKQYGVLVAPLIVACMAGLAVPTMSQEQAPAGVQPETKAPVAPAAVAAEIPMSTVLAAGDSFFESHIAGKVEVGTRMMSFILLEDTSPEGDSFVGSITMLREDQDYLPIRLFVQYKITPMVGVGLSYDKVGVEAWDKGGTDGTTILSGPLLYVMGRYPNSTAFTPFCELGSAFYSAKFEEDPGWANSANSKEFVLDDPQGYYLAIGCDWPADENWAVEVYGRYMNVDVKGEYMLNGHKRDDILFTSSNLAFGLGVKYSF